MGPRNMKRHCAFIEWIVQEWVIGHSWISDLSWSYVSFTLILIPDYNSGISVPILIFWIHVVEDQLNLERVRGEFTCHWYLNWLLSMLNGTAEWPFFRDEWTLGVVVETRGLRGESLHAQKSSNEVHEVITDQLAKMSCGTKNRTHPHRAPNVYDPFRLHDVLGAFSSMKEGYLSQLFNNGGSSTAEILQNHYCKCR